MDNDIKVSIFCLVYNHEKFLRKCLDGFVNQKTTFKYEVLIHDDASTDNSKSIIEEYYKKYPDKIVPFFETENQYSKHIPIINQILMSKAKGKYFAFCEGDDYWCDYNKLQRQYEYMEKYPDVSICMHNTKIHDITNETKDTFFNNWKDIHIMTEEDVFFGWSVHTTSYFIRKEAAIIPEFANHYWFGDYVRLTIAYSIGRAVVLPDIMSIYNYNNENGVTKTIWNSDLENKINRIMERKKYLEEYNEYTNKKYDYVIKRRINDLEMEEIFILLDNVNSYKEYRKYKKILISNKNFKKYIKEQKIIKKIKIKIKYLNFINFKIIKKIKQK